MSVPAIFSWSVISRHGVRFALSISIMLLMLLNTIGVLHFTSLNRLENFTYDVRLNMLMPRGLDDRIVIIDIDEKSLKEQGRWPWGRNKLADLVNKLFDDYHVKVLGFDVVFAEKDESSGLKSLEEIKTKYLANDQAFNQALETLKPSLDYDQLFANSLKNRNVVLGYILLTNDKAKETGLLPEASFPVGSFEGQSVDFVTASGFTANLDVLEKNAKTAGHINSFPDADGISRKVPILIQHEGKAYESLSAAVARIALETDQHTKLKLEAGYADGADAEADQQYSGLEWFQLGQHRIPVDSQLSALIPYRGPQGSFPYVSATDVLTQRVDAKLLENKIVLLGTTAAGLMDLRATPVQNIYAGVETHANMVAGILDNNIKGSPAYTLGAEFLLLVVVGLLLAFMLPTLSPLWATLLTLTSFLGVLLVNLSVWQSGLVLPLASLLVMITLIYVTNMSYGFFVESRGKRQLAGLFGQYVPPELVDEMAKNPEVISMEGESREMTVLFSDVRGFTTISEELDPKQLTQLMNEFLTPMTQVIHQGRGTIDKYMGDAIMAFWGAPLLDADHAKHALQAALGMIAALGKLQQDFAAKGWPPINIGVGLNTGLMTVGNMGSEFRMAYTVMGDAVNLGSRLESLTKNYGVHIIVSEFTKAQVPDFVYRELDAVRVKGKDKPVTIFEPVCEEVQLDEVTKENLARYHEALRLYRGQYWDKAELQFYELQKIEPQRALYTMYINRIAHFKENPPDSTWDSVFNFETK
ncbi:adenylate cyclase 1 [mine drainage metagenome]|uniref:Adenylate cyclase 1 n=1 Tax=mine drainage metagenome TaxID=410659 RepID=A0A1J5SKS2_9ZZZZ